MTTPLQTLTPSVAAPAAPNANTYTDPNGLAALKKDPRSPQAIKAVAQQVDALFMQMMLKSMRDASAAGGESSSNEMGMYQDMFDKQISLNLSQHQGLGLGTLVTRQLGGAPAAPATSTSATGVPAASRLPVVPPAAEAPGKAASPGQAAPPTSMTQTASDFVGQVLPTIRVAARALGVDPLALLAQAALETGWGQRMAHTADGKPSLNLFGIKADESWAGPRALASTVEYSGGVATLRHTAFRAYSSIEDSVKDFAHLLQSSPRYRQALDAGADTHSYAESMGRSGYATDPLYGNKLSAILNSGALHAAVTVSTTKL
jgi:peptidoglycan hydrolase FlgJ